MTIGGIGGIGGIGWAVLRQEMRRAVFCHQRLLSNACWWCVTLAACLNCILTSNANASASGCVTELLSFSFVFFVWRSVAGAGGTGEILDGEAKGKRRRERRGKRREGEKERRREGEKDVVLETVVDSDVRLLF